MGGCLPEEGLFHRRVGGAIRPGGHQHLLGHREGRSELPQRHPPVPASAPRCLRGRHRLLRPGGARSAPRDRGHRHDRGDGVQGQVSRLHRLSAEASRSRGAPLEPHRRFRFRDSIDRLLPHDARELEGPGRVRLLLLLLHHSLHARTGTKQEALRPSPRSARARRARLP